MKHVRLFIITIALSLLVNPIFAQEEFLPAGVRDISDRAYEPAVIELIDNAKESVVISMYSISVGKVEKNPVRLLLRDLLEARNRGVEVTLYLNTRFSFSNVRKYSEKLFDSSIFHDLKEAGCNINLIPSKYRLHDKLIIVDKRYIVESTANWSTSALKANFESGTLIDSPELAKIKLLRLDTIPLRVAVEEPPTPSYITELPKSIMIPGDFVTDEDYLTKFTSSNDNYSLSLYLLLLTHSQKMQKNEFFVDLEDMALSLGMPTTWSTGEQRRVVRKNLLKLKNRYGLIDELKLFHGIDAWIKLADLDGSTFDVPTDFLELNAKNKLTTRLKAVLIIKAYLKDKGEDVSTLSIRELNRRFGIHRAVLSTALKELKRLEEHNKERE